MMNNRTEMDSDIRFSNILSKTLDSLGYSFSAIQRRITYYSHYNKNHPRQAEFQALLRSFNGECVLAGSKREGVSLELESDFDLMCVNKNASCSDKLPDKLNFLN